ncbi:minichromosome maintenance- protein [Rhizophlyctis rosea]|nr:minichromosome maintenance- protein [Rhizophlyctis rosea]
MRGDDIPGDWVVIGVIASKSPPRIASTGQKYCMLKLTDLAGTITTIFAFKKTFEKVAEEAEGSVVAILNPKIILPSEETKAKHSIALDVDDPNKWMKVGDSLDFGFCKGYQRDGERCRQVVNTRHSDRCDEHALAVQKTARLHRQEFASGNAFITIGDPLKKGTMTGKQSGYRPSSLDTSTTYTFPSGHAFCADGTDVRDLKPCRGKPSTAADKEAV